MSAFKVEAQLMGLPQEGVKLAEKADTEINRLSGNLLAAEQCIQMLVRGADSLTQAYKGVLDEFMAAGGVPSEFQAVVEKLANSVAAMDEIKKMLAEK